KIFKSLSNIGFEYHMFNLNEFMLLTNLLSNELLNTILSGSYEKNIRQQIQVFSGHIDVVWGVEYSPFVMNLVELHTIKEDSEISCLTFLQLKKIVLICVMIQTIIVFVFGNDIIFPNIKNMFERLTNSLLFFGIQQYFLLDFLNLQNNYCSVKRYRKNFLGMNLLFKFSNLFLLYVFDAKHVLLLQYPSLIHSSFTTKKQCDLGFQHLSKKVHNLLN
ncbi:hypothetical protein RFI_24674, partial [Reticulomyxa filosa]